MSETPNTALRDAELAEEIRALRELASVEPQRYGAFRHHTAHVLARTLARLEQIAAPPSPGDVTGPTPTEDEPYQRVAAVVGDDLAALRACAEAWEPDVRLLGNVRASTIAALCIELEQFRTQNVSRGDVTGTPAPADDDVLILQETALVLEALHFARAPIAARRDMAVATLLAAARRIDGRENPPHSERADLTGPADKMVRLSKKGHAALKRLAANSGRTHADLLGEALRLLDAQTPRTSPLDQSPEIPHA